MPQVRIWNITDDARTSVVPHTRMVLGKVVKPGRSVLVDAERLSGATKVAKEVKAGYLHVGETLPVEYANQKKPPRATADARIVGSDGKPVGAKVEVAPGHGQFPAAAIASDGEAKVEETLSEAKPEEETTHSYGHEGYRKKNRR